MSRGSCRHPQGPLSTEALRDPPDSAMAAAQGGNSGSPAFPSCSQAHFLGHQLLFAPGPAKCFVYLLGKWWREWEFSPPLRKRVGVSDRCIHLEFKVQVCGGEDVPPPSAWADTEPRTST